MRTITVRGVGNVSARPDYIGIAQIFFRLRKQCRKPLITQILRRNRIIAGRVGDIFVHIIG